MLDSLFKIRELGTTVRTEVVAGFTTFMTMAYIVFVNPNILKDAGVPFEGVLFATCFSAAIACLFMAFLANYPIALAPGMGLNAYFTYTVCISMKVPWEVALGAVFLSGIFFLLLSIFGICGHIINQVPSSLKRSIAAGIGVFIALIGLQNAGIIAAHPVTMLTLGNLSEPSTLIALFGLGITALLLVRRVKGAIMLGILLATGLALAMKVAPLPEELIKIPEITPTFMKLDIPGALKLGILNIIVVFLFIDVLDSMGTLIGVGEQGGFIQGGSLPRANRAFFADAVGTIAGACTGTSTVTAYIESAAGVAEGGKTGLTNVVVALLFLIAIFFSPVAKIIPSAATAPALIIVGSLMIKGIADISWNDPTEAIPSFITIIVMPLSYSIAHGLAFGFISYMLLKLFAGRAREVSPMVWILGSLFLLRYLFI